MISILQFGIKNHPTLQRLILREMEPDDFTPAVAVALQQVLESSTPLRSLQFYSCELCGLVMKPIVQGLMQHPTVQSLHIENCNVSDYGDTESLEELIESSHVKLQTLILKNTDFWESIFHSLQQNTCIKYLNLGGEYDREENTLSLIETILRSNPRLMRLSLEKNDIVDNESFVSFMKTVVYDSSLRILDCGNFEDLDDAFKDLACWPIPQDPPYKECMLQELCLSVNDLADEGMQHFVTFLQVHTPRLRSLSLTCHSFRYEEAMHFAEWLRAKSSLVELCLRFHNYLDLFALLEIFAMLHNNHSTLKRVDLDGFNVYCKNLRRMIEMFTETVRVCQLESLHLEFYVNNNDPDDDSDDDSVEEEDSEPDFDELVQAFATNATLTNVLLSDNILNNIDTSNVKKIHFYSMRNKAFQKITSNLTVGGKDRNEQFSEQEEEDDFHVDDNDHLCDNDNSNSVIPLSVWPYILEVAHKQYPDASMLHHLLSLQTVGLVLSRREEMDVSSRTSTNENVRCRTIKRDHCQISAD
jgi:hypothetical protein